MFKTKISERVNNKKLIDKTMERALMEAEYYEPDSEEYKAIMDSINTLADTRQKLESDKRKISPDAVLNLVGTLILVLITLKYEEVHCMTSKAISWVRKLW